MFIFFLGNVLQTSMDIMKENIFTLAKGKSKRYLARTITDAYYAEDIVLLSYTPAPAEFLLHSLEEAAGCIGLHVPADKTEFVCFNQRNDISKLNRRSLKLIDNFSYIGRSVSSTENYINSKIAKAWPSIDRLSVI